MAKDNGTRELKYEVWSVLAEKEIVLLKHLGVVMLPEKRPREPKQKPAPLPEYFLTIHFKCILCNSEHTRYFHMQQQLLGYLSSVEVESIADDAPLHKQKKEIVSTCKHCKTELAQRSVSDLIDKCMKLSNKLGV
jgi:hypothetical protein